MNGSSTRNKHHIMTFSIHSGWRYATMNCLRIILDLNSSQRRRLQLIVVQRQRMRLRTFESILTTYTVVIENCKKEKKKEGLKKLAVVYYVLFVLVLKLTIECAVCCWMSLILVPYSLSRCFVAWKFGDWISTM